MKHVWQVLAEDGSKPDSGLAVVSTLHLAEGVQYRVVGESASACPEALPVQPGLEDGYVWLMRGRPASRAR